MGAKAGLGLKALQWFIRGVQFGCAALILALYSYFLATLANHNLNISNTIRAVEGISGAAVLYTLVGLLLLCCVAGLAFTSFVAMVLDLAFVGAFIYVAIANKNGVGSCNGYLDTPYGSGNSGDRTNDGSDGFTNLPSFRTACRLQTACFAVSIIAIIFFLLSILVEFALVRHHRKAKRFGPSPDNNYTSGYGASSTASSTKKPGLFARFMPGRNKHTANAHAVDNNALPVHTTPADLNGPRDNRMSHNTDATAIGEHQDHYKKEAAYGYPPQEAGVAEMGTEQPPRMYGSRQPPQTTAPPPQNYRYDDGVY